MSIPNIKLQPTYNHDGAGHIPYPLFINPSTGVVERAHPAIYSGYASLIGFTIPEDPYEIVITVDEWATNPERATGLTPAFADHDGNFFTVEWTAHTTQEDS